MNPKNTAQIVLELMRVSLISIRNISLLSKRDKHSDVMLREWAELCHSLPPILLGNCDARSIRYFLDGDAALFLQNYPSKSDADFSQGRALLGELNAVINTSET